MDRFTRQPSSVQPATASPGGRSHQSSWLEPTFGSKLLVIVLILAAIAVTVTLSWSAWQKFNATSLVKEEQYQAVFLDNGQVYFGKLKDVNSDYVSLTDIFYLQVEQQIQPDQETQNNTEDSDDPKISLAKLGSELHGPEDEMFISRDNIVFWENLKNDGQVTKAITDYKNQQ